MMYDEEMPEDEMLPEDELGQEDGLTPRMGAFESMLAGNMPGPAELNDLLGEGAPSFHESLAGENPPLSPRGSMGSLSAGEGALGGEPSADYTGQAPLDPAAVKEDIKSLLSQKAQERAAASEEFQARSSGMMKPRGGGY